MAKNLDYFKLSPDGTKNLINMEIYFKNKTNIDPITQELIKIRVSQLNGCAFCLNMHTIDALKMGETNQRIFLISAWWETDLFTDKEKAALALAENLTLVATQKMSHEVLDNALKHYSEKDFSDLVLMINQINSWNKMNVATFNDIDKDYK